ncbi:MAG: gluconeogenesis factor YvcK family protein, partial [Vicinamibacterales bacterium]
GHDRGHHVTRVWLEPSAQIYPAVRSAIADFDAVIIGPGSFFTSLMPTLLVDGVAEAVARVRGPVVLVANLLTEGRGMQGFSAAEEVSWVSRTIGRAVDVVIVNEGGPSQAALSRYEAEHKHPLPLGTPPAGTEVVVGEFWKSDIARHERQRLSYTVWSVLSRRLLE